MENVIVEFLVASHLTGAALLSQVDLNLPGLELDTEYSPAEIEPREEDADRVKEGMRVVVVRGRIAPGSIAELKKVDNVLGVWSDGRLEGFGDAAQ